MSSVAHATPQAECAAVSGYSPEVEQADSDTSASIDATKTILGSLNELTFVTSLPACTNRQKPAYRLQRNTETGAPPYGHGAPSQAIMDLDIAVLKCSLSALQIFWSTSVRITAAVAGVRRWS